MSKKKEHRLNIDVSEVPEQLHAAVHAFPIFLQIMLSMNDDDHGKTLKRISKLSSKIIENFSDKWMDGEKALALMFLLAGLTKVLLADASELEALRALD